MIISFGRKSQIKPKSMILGKVVQRSIVDLLIICYN